MAGIFNVTEVSNAALLCAAPAISMLLGSAMAFKVISSESKKLLCITQYFSAGILIAAIGCELVPKLTSTTDIGSTISIGIGFFAGVALMLSLETLMEGDDDEQEGQEKTESLLPGGTGTRKGIELWKTARIKVLSVTAMGGAPLKRKLVRSRKSATFAADMLSEAAACSEQTAIPYGAAIPIYVDSGMDGLLIGIVLTASFHAGAIMALATTIEMGFLGITFGAMLKSCGPKRWPAAAAAPVILVLGGVAGALFAGALAANPSLFNGIVAFGASALLFLVTHELLNEAKENMGEEDDWHLSIWLFIGFFFIILSERIFPES